jgi:hypothetical protein
MIEELNNNDLGKGIMKERIFTFLIFVFLLTGALPKANAQLSLSGDLVPGSLDDLRYHISVERGYVFNGCPLNVKFEWGADISGMVRIKTNSTEIEYPISSSSMTLSVDIGTAVAGTTSSLSFTVILPPGIWSDEIGPITLTHIEYPTVITDFSGKDLYDYYYGRTTQYPGKIEFSRTGGSPDLQYSIDGIRWTPFPGTTASLTPLEIQNLIPGSRIMVREPYGCMNEVPFIAVPEQSRVAGVISRQVFIPPVEHATIIPSPGIHYVVSGKNYVFKILPTGPNAGLRPEVTTGRSFVSDEESISYRVDEDGLWTVTLYAVREPLSLDIAFTDMDTESAATAGAFIEGGGSRVWGADGTVYIASATAGTASIYGSAGALVKTVAYPSGTTATPLPAGFYIASLDRGNYKIIVK